MKRLAAFVMMCVAFLAVWAQPEGEDTRMHIFDSNVRSLRVSPASNMYLPPVIVMGSDDRLNVNFDYIDYDLHYLRYSVQHCDALWQPSQLMESEYVDGFNQADITEYAQSEATFVHYYNYSFTFPNDDMRLLKSGNYVLRVYEQNDPEQVLFQTRFMVCEGSLGVYADVTSRTDEDYNEAHQQLSVELKYKPMQVADPYNELTMVIYQNTRTDNAVVLKKPMRVEVGATIYEHQPELIFAAGNEYRRFETVNEHAPNMRVAEISYYEPLYHATVMMDYPRCQEQYLYDQTRWGRFTIRNAEANNSDTQADYFLTHFTLNTGGPVEGGNIFLEGEFTHGHPAQDALMRYDASSGCYTCEVLLKQGAYNYQYLFVPDGSTQGLTSVIEGDRYQTVNQYLVAVYHRPSGERYDHFVGFAIVRSGR